MTSTYVNDLRLNEMATGDQSGSWGTVTNTNLELISEAFSFGTEAITTNADTHTTTIADGATDPGRSMFLKYTGTLDSACTITIGPNTVSKLWFIENATSGSQNIIIKQGSGATVTIASGKTKVIYSDGVGSAAKMVDAFDSLSVGALASAGAVSGTTGTFSGAVAGTTGTFSGAVTGASATFDGGVDIDNINIDGTTIALSSGDLTLDASGDIILDADGADIKFRDGGAGFLTLSNNSLDAVFTVGQQDEDFIVRGYDGASLITALTLDMSEAGRANFNNDIGLNDDRGIRFGSDDDSVIYNDGSNLYIKNATSNQDIIFQGNDDGSANTTALTLDMSAAGAATFNSTIAAGAATFTTADNTNQLTLVSTDADANAGPNLNLRRNSASPADGDLTGQLTFTNNNDAGEGTDYATMYAVSADVSDGSEDAAFYIKTMSAGTLRQRISLTDTATVFNEDSIDLDFRVESDGDANMLFVDGGNNRVGIGTSSPSRNLTLSSSGQTDLAIIAASGSSAQLCFGDGDDDNVGQIEYSHPTDSMRFYTQGTEQMRLDSSGNVLVGTTTSGGSSGLTIQPGTSGSPAYVQWNKANSPSEGCMVFRFNGASKGSVTYTSTGTAFNTTSDYRVKENVVDLTGASARVNQLDVKQFNFIDDDTNTLVDGFLAHEVATVVPEAITGAKDEVKVWKDSEELPDGVSVGDNKLDDDGNTIPVYQGIDQSKLVPLLTAALQEALAKIDAMETRLTALEG